MWVRRSAAMNIDAAFVEQEIVNEAAQHVDLPTFRRHAMRHLRLKTVVRESHNRPITALRFNATAPDQASLFATVGGNLATIYDDAHMGDYVAVVAQLENSATEHAQGGGLAVCEWLAAGGATRHPQGDALLAVAGDDPAISVISVVQTAVVALLKGHEAQVVELSAATSRPGLLLSLSRDGNLRLWDALAPACLLSLHTDAVAAALHPEASYIVTGSRQGRLACWALRLFQHESAAAAAPQAPSAEEAAAASSSCSGIPAASSHAAAAAASGQAEAQPPRALPSHSGRWALAGPAEKQAVGLPGLPDASPIDCLRFLTADRLAARCADGRLHVWNFTSQLHLASWRIPGTAGAGSAAAAADGRCAFGATADGAFLCAGNSSGDVYVFDTSSGAKVCHCAAIKVSGAVRACGLSHDCRHLAAVVGAGFLFRFEYCKPEKGKPGGKPAAAGRARAAGAGAGSGRLPGSSRLAATSGREAAPPRDTVPSFAACELAAQPPAATCYGAGSADGPADAPHAKRSRLEPEAEQAAGAGGGVGDAKLYDMDLVEYNT